MAKVLVACEYSGTVRDAFIRAGHDAMSCDILPTEAPGPHYQGDVRDIMGESFDLVVAHPECTYLANSGVSHLTKSKSLGFVRRRWDSMRAGAEFFSLMFDFNSPRICVENPIQHKYAIEAHGKGKPTQYVQPWMYGHPESKKTGLWLVNLPKLKPENDVYDEMLTLSYSERNRIHCLPPSDDRWKIRSKTFEGIAQAMANQWGSLLEATVPKYRSYCDRGPCCLLLGHEGPCRV